MEKEMKIVKAEILFSRQCNLNCSYCGMVDGRSNTRTVEEWKTGILNLKELGCQFIGWYGAEPMLEFEKLKLIVPFAEKIGINTTIITSGVVPHFRDKLKELHYLGAPSLSMSYDMLPLDKASEAKSEGAIDHLEYFQSLGDVRDVAAIATITRTNFHLLPETIINNSAKGIWTFFDFIHPDRGLPGSKCKGNAEGLLFQDGDYEMLLFFLNEVLELKKLGYLVHVSEEYINLMQQDNFSLLKNYNWNCAKHDVFPSWVTVDCDGSVHYCDDFQEQKKKPKFDMTTLEENWDKFSAYGKELVKNRCRGCAWSTHIDAHYIKMGVNDIKSYVHGEW
jgi:MoaA/NifB/PqqE/SkfB family radical SAM enzyme